MSERIRFCASASRTAAFDLDADDGIDSELLLSQQSIASSVASPRSTPATDRKRTALTVRSQQVIYFFPPAHPVVCRGARRRRAHARGMCCRQQGGKGAASRGVSDLGSQQQQARSHVRAAGASGEELGRARNGHGVEALCASPSQPSSPAAAGRRGLWGVDPPKTTGSRSYRGYGPQMVGTDRSSFYLMIVMRPYPPSGMLDFTALDC